MSKKILVLTGSARKGGNSNRMAEAFAAAATVKGNDVKVIDTAADAQLLPRMSDLLQDRQALLVRR